MKIYLWYDEFKKRYGRSNDFVLSYEEVLYSFEKTQWPLSQKVASNLNKIR